MPPDFAAVRTYLLSLQDTLCSMLEAEDGTGKFRNDEWTRPEGGGGRTRLLAEGNVFEKAGVAFSHVRGDKLPPSATAHRPELAGRSWEAVGLSLVIHPRNPLVPTTHMNVRFFLANGSAVPLPRVSGSSQPSDPGSPSPAPPVWWFGGGFDLTPYYGFEEDAVHWHRTARDAIAPMGETLYPRFKKWCDDYFYLPHRNESRGVGGIFYDNLDTGNWRADFEFTRDVGQAFAEVFPAIVRRRMNAPWTDEERDFQLIRRGRYVEFNLLYDRGTQFGLKTGGNVEAILMSLPPNVKWP